MAHVLLIRTTIKAHKQSKDVTLEFCRTIDFVPVEGMKFRFTNDNSEVMEVELVNLYFDYEKRQWVEEQEDDTLTDDLRSAERVECIVTPQRMQEYTDYYRSFGWE